jgi:CRP-like cAMP-binding protein
MRTENHQILMDAFGLSESGCDSLDRYCDQQSYPGNSVIYYQDDPTTTFYVLVRGHVRQSYINENGMVTLISVVPPGRSFGESGCLDEAPHCDTAFTIGPTDVISIDLAGLRSNVCADEMRHALGRIMARRYRSHVELTRALYLPTLSLRLSHTLLRLIENLGNAIRYRGQVVECIGPIVTQQDLGSMARGTRENVNKTLRGWEKQGIIALEDRHILILDRARLEQIEVDGG